MNENKYSSKRRVLLEVNDLISFHLTSMVDKKVNKKREIKNFYQLYKKMEYKTFHIEEFIKNIELKTKYSYEDLLVLSNYKYLITSQKIFFELFNMIYKHVLENEYLKYAKLKYFDSKLGIATVDYITLYNKNSFVTVDWNKEVKSKLLSNYGEFYYNYFMFKIIYVAILNINVDANNKNAYNNFIEVCTMLKKLSFDFNHY